MQCAGWVPCCPRSLSSDGAVLLPGEPMTKPCCVRKVMRFGELGGLGNSNGGMAWGERQEGETTELYIFCLSVVSQENESLFCVMQSKCTLEGEPRIVGRGLRWISSLSLGEECRGRPVISPAEGATTGSECCFLIFCLPPPVAHSNRQGALWSRVPSPVTCGCCWETSLGSMCCRAAK